jgi:zinc D-Ala-D-Ala carboxypeptidase
MRLSPHFDHVEFLDRRTGDRLDPGPMLLGALEHLRGELGRPLPLLSGFRTPETNAAVGGAPRSRHLVGDAVDIRAGLVRVDQAERAGFVGIGTRGGWAVHLDVRPGPPARWTY